MSPNPPVTAGPIDVDALMRDLRRRVAEKKARGLYVTDVLARDAMEAPASGGVDESDVERLRSGAVVRQRLLVGASTRPLIGKFVERVKRFAVRASFDNLADVTAQQTRFNADVSHAVKALVEQLDSLAERVAAAEMAAIPASAARQDAAVSERLARAGQPVLLVSGPDIDAVSATSDGEAFSVGVLRAAVPSDADGLGELAVELARTAAPGAIVALAPPAGNAEAVAALLHAVGFTRAHVEAVTAPSSGSGQWSEDCIVIAER